MPRIKKGLDYYSFPTDTFHDLRIKRLRRKCRNNGMLVYFYLITEAYRTSGYSVNVGEELVMDISEYFYLTDEEVEKIILTCCTEGLFDLNLYKKYNVLTSTELQEHYAEICIRLRRSSINIRPEHLLINKPEPYQRNKTQKTEDKAVETDKQGEEKQDMSFQCTSTSTQMKRNEMKRKEMKPLPSIPSPESGRGEAVAAAEEEIPLEKMMMKEEEEERVLPCPNTPCPRGEGRNYTGMVEALQRLRIDVKDINAILKLSNFGEVGDPAWRALYTIGCAPPGTFKQPAKYIYSIIQKARQQQRGGVVV